MLAVERRDLMLEILRSEKSAQVTELARRFEVSDETVRRDLEKLERSGLVTRTHGGATLNGEVSELPYILRKKTNVEAKQAIAKLVAGLVEDGDFLMLDESSTSMFVARAIRSKRGVTLITNSIEIVLELSETEGWNILSTGGSLKAGVLAMTGHQAENFIRDYHVSKAIISCTAFDIEAGFTDAGEDNARIKQAMMASARETILAVDSRKFDKKAFARVGELSELGTVVTDAAPSERWSEALQRKGVELICP